VGGLIGIVYSNAQVTRSHSTGNATGEQNVGGLVGLLDSGILAQVSSSQGTVVGTMFVGGLVGLVQNSGVVANSFSTAQVNAPGSTADDVGGLAGAVVAGTLSDSYATGAVHGHENVGGLVGAVDHLSSISRTFASGAVDATATSTGGLVGRNSGAPISNSFATGSVSSDASGNAGGLVGLAELGTLITDSYATGAVAGGYVGGLVGALSASQIERSFASAPSLAGSVNVGGLLGSTLAGSTVADSYYSTGTAGAFAGTGNSPAQSGVTGLSPEQMLHAANFAGLDIATGGSGGTAWRQYEGQTLPMLSSFMTAVTVTVGDASKVYDAQAAGAVGVTLGSTVAPSIWHPRSTLDGTLVRGSASSNAVNVGSYALDADGLYSSQLGYDFTASGSGVLTITPAPLTVTTGPISKTYDGSTSAVGAAAVISAGSLFGTDALTGGSFAFTDKNAGSGKTVSVSGVTVNDGNNGANYAVTLVDNTSSVITPKVLTVSGIAAADKVYDGSSVATITNAGSLSGLVDGETLGVGAVSASFADKNAGVGKVVSVGAYALADGTGAAANYTLAANSLTTTADITPAVLTVTAGNAVRLAGQANPVFVATTTGLVGGDTLATVASGDLVLSTSANASSPAGFYAITPSGYVLLGGNYTLSYVNGQLTVGAGAGGGAGAGFAKDALAAAVSDAQTYLSRAIEAKDGIEVVYLDAAGQVVPDALAVLAGRDALGQDMRRERAAGSRGDLQVTVREGGIRLPAGLATK
jgi:hypothetical protein